jgi:hypothetical protein
MAQVYLYVPRRTTPTTACPLRARQGGEARGLTVTHGDSGMHPDLRGRWPAGVVRSLPVRNLA